MQEEQTLAGKWMEDIALGECREWLSFVQQETLQAKQKRWQEEYDGLSSITTERLATPISEQEAETLCREVEALGDDIGVPVSPVVTLQDARDAYRRLFSFSKWFCENREHLKVVQACTRFVEKLAGEKLFLDTHPETPAISFGEFMDRYVRPELRAL